MPKEESCTPTIAWSTTPEQQRIIPGAISYLLYVGLWLGGLASPGLVLGALAMGWWKIAIFLILGIALSFLPRWAIPLLPWLQVYFRTVACQYFRSSTLMTEAPIDVNRPTIFCIHPHGIFCIGWAAATLFPQLGHLTWCFSSALEKAPFFRIFLRLLNKDLAGASKETVVRLLKEKRSMGIIPGGFEEATLHCAGVDRVYLKNRRGLFKYALQQGYSMTPIYAFGERDTYTNLQGAWKFRHWLNGFALPAIVPFGAWFCPILPRPETKMLVVVGKPLQLPLIANPTKEDVAEWHGKYIVELQALYKRHAKTCYGPGNHQLELW